MNIVDLLKSAYTASMTEKSRYSIRWGKIASLTGVVSPLAIHKTLGDGNKTGTEQFEIDEDVFDPTASQNVFTLANYTFTMLFGNRQRFLIKADDDADQDFYDDVAVSANEILDNPESNFASAARQTLETSAIPFGNAGLVYRIDEERKTLLFEAATCTDACIGEGKDNRVSVLYLTKLVSPAAFEETFGEMPKEIQEALNKRKDGESKDILLVYALCENPYYNKYAVSDSEFSKKYCGVFFCADGDIDSDWHHINYFDWKMFVFYRNIVMRGELYARGNIDRVLSSVDSVNELTRMANDSVERMENPAIAITAEINSDSVIDMSPGGVNVLTPQPGQNGTPMFAMQPAGDPSGILKTTMPRLDSAITQAFGLSMFLDIQPVAGMTAHQVVEGTITRNKNLLPTYLGYREQILLPLYNDLVSIVLKKKWYKTKYEAPQAKKYKIIPLTSMEEVYTSNILDKLQEISNIMTLMRQAMPQAELLFSIYPMVANAVKGTKYEPYLVPKSKFEERVKAAAAYQTLQNMTGGTMKGGFGNDATAGGTGSSDVKANVAAAEGAK